MPRPTLEQAKARYPHRYTLEHVPSWAKSFCTFAGRRKYYAPQFVSDREWYDNTVFDGDLCDLDHCYTTGQTWPLGKWLDAPFEP